MKGSRQKSPGTVIRVGDAMDEPNTNLITAEPDEFVPNIHPPTDDEGVRNPLIAKLHQFLIVSKLVDITPILPSFCYS